MPPIHLLIKPSSGNCNMRCDYCFYYDITEHREQASYGFMSEETLEQVIKKALECAEGECSFSYQGGEPTLHGLAFFEKSLEFERKHNIHGVKINHALQTNGYRLNADWAKFLADNHFLVGVSLDGSKDTHNAYRRSVKGEETFFDIMKTIDILNEYQVEFNILTVVNRRTAGKVRKIYQFYKKNHLNYLQFIPCLDPLGEQQGSREYSLTAELYGEFLKDLFDLWYDDLLKGEQPYIRQFENYIAILMGHHPEACDQSGVCNYQYVVEADGEVYPCDFYVLDEYKLGNLNDCSIEDIDKKRHEIGFMEYSLTDHEACRQCRHFLVCRGGCRRHRLLEEADGNHRNVFCDSYLAFFDHAMPRMADIARRLSR
ncbi:MAG: anaerobic sulfatase maturase [Hungatella hathewayi]|nr:anaerobic sulfatase maturase [Hungatella hathewayi]